MGCARLNVLKVQSNHAKEAHQQIEPKAEHEKERSRQVTGTNRTGR